MGGFIRDPSGVVYQSRIVICDRYADSLAFPRIQDALPEGRDSADWGKEYYIALTGTNCSFRREALLELGGFDEAYAYFLDETDVLMRLVDAGYAVVCAEGAEVHHKYAASAMRTENNTAKTLYLPIRSKCYFAMRHALSCRSLDEVTRKLQGYCDYILSCQEWHYREGKIDKAGLESLKDDIRRGYRDGVSMAFNVAAPYTKPESFFENPPGFRVFSPLRPLEQRLRICFISQDYTPDPNGGIGVWVSALATGLAGHGHEVAVVTRARNGNDTVDFENGVWVHRVVQRHMPNRMFAAPDDLPQLTYDWAATAYAEVKRIALLRGLDIVSAPIWDVEGIVCHCEGSFPTVLSLHTSYALAEPSKPLWHSMPGYMDRHVAPIIRAEARLFKEAPLLLANSQAIVRDLEQLYATRCELGKVVLVPHGLKDVAEAAVQADPIYSAGSEACTILFVGRFEERKGIDTLLGCIPELLERFPRARFVLAGDNSLTPCWEQFRKKHRKALWLDRVAAPGHVSRDELTALYKGCDIFVAPSRYESFGLIYLEAMMFEKPCVGTTAGGIPEVVANGVNGITVPPGDVRALNEALTALIRSKELRKNMGKASRERFLESFTEEKMVLTAEKYFLQFLSRINDATTRGATAS